MTAPTTSSNLDSPVAVQGYVTDPKWVGYQVLTNYESTYWAPLIGNDAWRLYEVLRSFCHHGNQSCHPSINLLIAILGLKDRSILIGRSKPKIVKGKEYYYPGLIQVLQDHNLAVAEVTGEGPKLRYTFHVNLSPGLLAEQQLEKLPEILQTKHAKLLERCAEEQKALEAKKRPPKLQQKEEQDKSENGEERGIGISNTPLGNSNTPSWKFQYKQQPINNTHRTTARAREDLNNNSSGTNADKNDVVVAIFGFGIGKKVAQRLADRYSRERIFEKIGYLQFLLDERPDQVKNPRGWLRKAIEEDYGAPDGFVTAEERQRQAEAAEQRRQEDAAAQQAALEAAEQSQKARETQMAEIEQQLASEWGTDEKDLELWEQVKLWLTHSNFSPMFLAAIRILKLDDDTAKIGVDNDFIAKQLSHPGTLKQLGRAFKSQLKHEIEIELITIDGFINQKNQKANLLAESD
ncbi:MAG: hypothetical protein KDE50_00830 [Caldilineaceae bacterium]|nr:hypothetical protein [Caldilineaceae bacterium]MCB0138430.1 hypothetical protein [Caldilineaceae bacterium]